MKKKQKKKSVKDKIEEVINTLDFTEKTIEAIREGEVLRSPLIAIQLKCLDCGNWSKDTVRNCASNKCPLYFYRPYLSEEEINGHE